MNLLIITVSRGRSPYWAATAASVAEIDSARHVIVGPAEWIEAERRLRSNIASQVEDGPGLYSQLNHALRVWDCDAFTWINDDDVLCAPGFIRAVAAFGTKTAPDILYGRVRMIDAAGSSLGELPVAHHAADLPALLARGVVPLAQPGTLIRRQVWQRLGGFDEAYRLAGDLDFFVRAAAAGMTFGFIDAELAAFRLVSGQLSKQRVHVETESARALGALRGSRGGLAAFCRFRWDNRLVYLKRLRRHGFRSMRQIYDEIH